MAFVRKLQLGDKAEKKDKKVLTYENVGTYDADALASTLTLSLEKYSRSLNLSNSDRLTFLKYGTSMIQAIKDGNVTRNPDGTLSINGEYGLNNTYTDSEVEKRKSSEDDDKLGRGASKYEGQYLKSHGIFTSNETRNFRHNNHLLGLIGKWVNDTVDKSSALPTESAASPEETPYSFDLAFNSTYLGELRENLNEWLTYTPMADRASKLRAVLDNADYTKWADATKGTFGNAEEFKESLIRDLGAALDAGNLDLARLMANKYGFSLSPYLAEKKKPGTPPATPTVADRNVAYWKKVKDTIASNHPEYTEELLDMAVAQEKRRLASETLKLYNDDYDNQLLAALNLYTSDYIKGIKQPEQYRHVAISDDNSKYLSHSKDEKFLLSLATMLENLSKRDFSTWNRDDNPKAYDSTLNMIDALIDAYANVGAEGTDPIYQLFYTPVTGDNAYAREGWIALTPTVTDHYTFIFNPKTKEFRRVHNMLLPGTPGYNYLTNDFTSKWRAAHPTPLVSYEKEGGIIKAQAGSATLAWLQNMTTQAHLTSQTLLTTNKKKTQEKPANYSMMTPEAKKKYLLDVLNADHGLLYTPETDDEGNPIELHYFYTDEQGMDISKEDIARLIGLGGDIASLGGGWWDLGGAASIITNAYADFSDAANGRSTYDEAWGNLGTNAGLTVAGLIPSLSSLKVVKDIKAISKTSKVIPWVIGAFAASGVINNMLAGTYMNAIDNIVHDKYSSLDLQELLGLGELIASMAFKKGSIFKGDGPVGGIRQRRVSNITEHLTGTGDKPSITTASGKRFELTSLELDYIKNAGTSYDVQNQAFKDVQDARRLNKTLDQFMELKSHKGPEIPTSGEEQAPKYNYENLQIGSREGFWHIPGTEDTRKPKTAKLDEQHTGNLALTSTYVDSKGNVRQVNTPWGTTALYNLPDMPTFTLGKGEVIGYAAPPKKVTVTDGTFTHNGYEYTYDAASKTYKRKGVAKSKPESTNEPTSSKLNSPQNLPVLEKPTETTPQGEGSPITEEPRVDTPTPEEQARTAAEKAQAEAEKKQQEKKALEEKKKLKETEDKKNSESTTSIREKVSEIFKKFGFGKGKNKATKLAELRVDDAVSSRAEQHPEPVVEEPRTGGTIVIGTDGTSTFIPGSGTSTMVPGIDAPIVVEPHPAAAAVATPAPNPYAGLSRNLVLKLYAKTTGSKKVLNRAEVAKLKEVGHLKKGGNIDFIQRALALKQLQTSLEELQNRFFRAGGRLVTKASTGTKFIILGGDGTLYNTPQEAMAAAQQLSLSASYVREATPAEITAALNKVSVLPEGVTLSNGLNEADVWDSTNNKLKDGYEYQVNGLNWASLEDAQRYAKATNQTDVTVALKYGRQSMDLSAIGPDAPTSTKTGGNYNYYSTEAQTEAALIEAYYKAMLLPEGEARNKALETYNKAEQAYLSKNNMTAFKYYDKGRFKFTLDMLTATPEERAKWNEELQNGIVDYFKWQTKQHESTSPKNWNLFKGDTQDFANIDWKGVTTFMNGRKDAAKYDAQGNIVYNTDGSIALSEKSKSGGPAHRSINGTVYGNDIVNWTKGEDGNYSLATDPIDERLWTKDIDSNKSTTADKDITNKYWKRNEDVKLIDGKYYTKKDNDWYGDDGKKYNLDGTAPVEIVTPTGDDEGSKLPNGLNLMNGRNWGNIGEFLRALGLTYANRLAADQAKWDHPYKGFLHRNELLEGNYAALQEAQLGGDKLHSQASRTFTSDAATLLAGQLQSSASAEDLRLKGVLANSQRFFDTRHRVLDMYNQDLLYNTNVADQNRLLHADWELKMNNLKANLTIENSKIWSNLFAGYNKQWFDANDRQKQLAISYNMSQSELAKQIAANTYNNKVKMLDPKATNYETKLQEYQLDYLDATKQSNWEEAVRTNDLLKPAIWTTRTIYDVPSVISVKKGSKLTSTEKFMLLRDKDFNKRKLEDSREFYRNMRENNKRNKRR